MGKLAFEERGIEIELEMLDEMVLEAVASLRKTYHRPDPRSDLTPEEVAALEEGGFNLDPPEPGPDDPLARAAADYAALLHTALTTSEAAERLGVDPSRIRQRLTAQPPGLYGIRLDAEWRIPVFQFEGNRVLPGWAQLLAQLSPDVHPVAFHRWLTLPHSDLLYVEEDDGQAKPVSPRDWLRAGYPSDAVADLVTEL